MTLLAVIVIAGGAAAALVAAWLLARAWTTWRRFRGERVVTCPETGYPAAVRIDALRAGGAALRSSAAGAPRLAACSRWPTRGGRCDEDCLGEALCEDSRTSAIAEAWYAGRACAYCGAPVRDDPSVSHHPALLGPDGVTREWPDVAAEQLRDALRSSRPVCWNCHVAETFRRTHPRLVTDRPR